MEMKKKRKTYIAHGKGTSARQRTNARTHDIESLYDNVVHLCRGSFLCYGLVSLFAMRCLFAVRLEVSLP
jgi:hypothetical protein